MVPAGGGAVVANGGIGGSGEDSRSGGDGGGDGGGEAMEKALG